MYRPLKPGRFTLSHISSIDGRFDSISKTGEDSPFWRTYSRDRVNELKLVERRDASGAFQFIRLRADRFESIADRPEGGPGSTDPFDRGLAQVLDDKLVQPQYGQVHLGGDLDADAGSQCHYDHLRLGQMRNCGGRVAEAECGLGRVEAFQRLVEERKERIHARLVGNFVLTAVFLVRVHTGPCYCLLLDVVE